MDTPLFRARWVYSDILITYYHTDTGIQDVNIMIEIEE